MVKRVYASLILVLFVASIVIVSAYAVSINAQVKIDERLNVVLEFKNVAEYDEIYQSGEVGILNATKKAIEGNLAQRRLSGYVGFDTNPVVFDNETKSIKIVFYMAGSDVFHTEVDTEKASRLCKVRTDWRRVRLNFSETVTFDLSRYFGVPVAQWQNSTDDEGRMRFVSPQNPDMPESSFSFTLPSSARNVRFAADKETIFFELPLSFGDQLLNSPILVLIILVIIVCVVLVYRKIVI
jgi:hypothetical protein